MNARNFHTKSFAKIRESFLLPFLDNLSNPNQMKNFISRLSLVLSFALCAVLAQAQTAYETIGIIGSSTPGGWDASTAMELSNASDPHQWTLTLMLSAGEAKFRANNNWSVNWGSGSFPSGNGVQNGPNIPIAGSGYYTISFNDVTGAYNFQLNNAATYNTVGLIGNATPGGWDASTPMTKDPADPHRWSITVSLTNGEAKFRAENSWDVNWGGTSFPSGTANQNGPNIPIAAGEYEVTFNDFTREYFFRNLNPVTYASVGTIGSATSLGWDTSTPMKAGSSANEWTLTTYLTAGELKFRANNSWDVNWGGSGFPSGTAERNGPNIPITELGYYSIAFNDLTSTYTILKLNPTTYASVGIIGTATSNGWDASTPMAVQPDGHTWTLTNAQLFNGEAKFRADNSWTVNWGATTFPAGTGTQGGPNIPVTGGFYNITFNDVTSEYFFELTGTGVNPIVALNPELPTAEESVTIIYDATQGVSGLRGVDKVYMHAGVILSGFDGTGWSNVVGNWGQDDGVGEMSRVPGEENKWQITLPGIREYFGVAEGVPVFRLGMVFRSANGAQTGKSSTDGDIFVNIDAGDFTRFTAPVASQIFALAGEQITISAETSSTASTISLEINEGDGFVAVSEASNANSITYNYLVTQSFSLQVRVTAVLAESTVSSTKEISVIVRQPNTVAALPAGLKNGINYDPNDATKATLVLLAPGKQFVYALGDFNNWNISESSQMKQTADGEYFWIELTNLVPQREYVFQYWVDGTIKIGDPYADKVADPYNDHNIPADVYPNPIVYTNTENGIATVLQTGQQSFQWTHPTVAGGQPAKENLVIYELLLRDFLKSHSYADLADTLSYLKRLGVNAIELLPIMEFEGNESWGYNPSYLFAPDKYYGTKNDLKAFINKAHEEGFVVLLDMVLNHQFGQSPMVRMYFDQASGKPTPSSPWFNQDPTHPFNVGYDFNHESAYTKRYIDDVNRYWLEEYHFDGYRFDLSKGFTQVNNPNDVGAWSAYDQSRVNILTRMTDVIWQTNPNAYMIMEHLADNSEEKVLADYGIMLWGNMNHPYNNAMNGQTGTDLNWTLSSTRNWNEKNLVPYMESHDEERLMVRALSEGLSSGNYSIRDKNTALERVKLASAFFYPLPGPKMLWQFGEIGYDISINFNGRVGNKPLPWGEEDGLNYYEDPERIRLYKATAAIINLVNEYNDVFENGNFSWTPSGQFRRISVGHADMSVTIIGNFGVTPGTMAVDVQHTGTWYDFFSGRSYNFSSTNQTISLEPGEFHIFVDQVVDFPEPGLVYTPVYIGTPTNLIAAINENSVAITWADNSDGEQGYVIERQGEDESSFVAIATAGADETSYTDEQIIDGVTYTYRVQTVSDVRPASDWSNTAVADLPLKTPGAVAAEAISKKTITVTWTDNSLHETSYVVERSVAHGNHTSPFAVVGEVGAGTEMFTDFNISPGKTYSYRVSAKDNDEQSSASEIATVRPSGKKPKSLVSIYPNAASDVVSFSHGENSSVRVRVVNMQGVVLNEFELKGDQPMQVRVGDWPEGLYYVEARWGAEVTRVQLVVKR